MTATSTALEGGFADPVFDAQGLFRALMDAMAEPGTRRTVHALANPPVPMSATAGAIALALCDHDTPVWLDEKLRTDEIVAWLQFQTGAPITGDPAGAHFAFVADPEAMPSLGAFAQGTQDYPDRSTTIVLLTKDLDSGHPLSLEGPGIETRSRVAPSRLPDAFGEQWDENRARFPRGVDLILAGPGAVACLPRTTRVLEAREA